MLEKIATVMKMTNEEMNIRLFQIAYGFDPYKFKGNLYKGYVDGRDACAPWNPVGRWQDLMPLAEKFYVVTEYSPITKLWGAHVSSFLNGRTIAFFSPDLKTAIAQSIIGYHNA